MAGDPQRPESLKHELRTPLNHILGYCEMLIEVAQDQGHTRLIPDLEKIHAAGRTLLATINDLFDPDKTAALEEKVLHHELRTPLNQVIGYVGLLKEDSREIGQETLVPDLERIERAARQLLQLVVDHLAPGRFGPEGPPPLHDAGATTFLRREVLLPESHPSSAPAPADTNQARLLVVDDNDLNRDMLVRRLQRLGYVVAEAAHGRQALERIRAEPFDLVLLDILMPEMNGYEVLDHLKSDPALRALPVIVLSASDQAENVARCIEMGAEDYLSKPFDPVLLQARLNASLEKKRLRDREISHLRQIEEEKRRSDELLHVILPADVAAELKATQAVQPRRFDPVGVLFCDIVDFTAYCEQHPPETVLNQLQDLVEAFELLTLQHELEKIKTIGDSFMATAGLLAPAPNPALNCIRCGLAMIAAAKALPPHWEVRVGVHVGPVIAGVVGHRKYQYDVWGDTVNTAARMEERAPPGGICVNGETWARLEHACRGRLLGSLHIKGKGDQKLFLVEGLTP